MKFKFHLLIGALSCCVALTTHAQSEPSHEDFGKEKSIRNLTHIRIENHEGVTLGRIKDLGIDLVNGRIIVVFVVSGEFLGMGGKIVAVPPLALRTDPTRAIYYLNASPEEFNAAPAVKFSELPDNHRTDLVAATYRRFGQEPYFLVTGETASVTASRPKVPLGIVQRSGKILHMPVTNLQNEPFGTVSGLTYSLAKGTIRAVIVAGPGFSNTKSVIPPTALSFNPTHEVLLLDQTKIEFANQPRMIVTDEANGQGATSVEESYKGPRTTVALEQGDSYRDIDRTALITRNLRAAKIKGLVVKVGTLDSRVTLRGSAASESDKSRAGAIAVAASRLEVVDNQLLVRGSPLQN